MDLTKMQRLILVDLFIYGDDAPRNIGRRLDYHRNSVSSVASGRLTDEGLVVDKGGGVYQLTGDGQKLARDLITGAISAYGGNGI